MNRSALILYLENVRDLEILKIRIKDLWKKEADRYSKDLSDFPTEVEKPRIEAVRFKPDGLNIFCIIFALVSLVTLIHFMINPEEINNDNFWLLGPGVCFIFFGLLGGIGLKNSFDEMNQAKRQNEDNKKWYMDALVTAKANKNYLNKRSKEWDAINTFYEDQYSKADAILDGFYNMNIIPKQFRGASGACYLYDYMSSSNESFQMALISNQIEEGIKRIEARLNYISCQISEVLYQQRVIRAENRAEVNRRIEHDKNMINTFKSMESRQANIEEYSRLSANYNEAAALFSLATYLKY